MIEEVRRQFKEIEGLLAGDAEPDSARCVEISTRSAIREMVVPGADRRAGADRAGVPAGHLGAGRTAGGRPGHRRADGADDGQRPAACGTTPRKYIEEGHHGGKGSEPHKAAVIGDTVGDPFKDTSGPSLNILIKLMSVVAVIFAPLVVAWMS